MSISKGIRNSILYGLIAGVVLTVLLKTIEHFTLYKVYTLLLNVDYIPILNTYNFGELIEVSFHLIVSIVLGICLYFFILFLKLKSHQKIIYISIVVCTIIGVVLFPTTMFSDRTPEITSVPSLFFWLFGHAIYGYLLGYLFAQSMLNKSDSSGTYIQKDYKTY